MSFRPSWKLPLGTSQTVWDYANSPELARDYEERQPRFRIMGEGKLRHPDEAPHDLDSREGASEPHEIAALMRRAREVELEDPLADRRGLLGKREVR